MVDFTSTMTSVPEGDGSALFHGALRNLTGAPLPLTLVAEPCGSWMVDFQVNGEWSSEATIPLAPHALTMVVLRVRTDGTIRLGAARLIARSELSGRTETHSFRVFNGSPSILLVDDDQGRMDETSLQRALGAAQLLHGPRSPALALSCAPNPFFGSTDIRLQLFRAGPARIDIMDLSGRLVRRLLDRRLPAGDHQVAWDGCNPAGRPVPGGVYFLRAHAGALDGVPGGQVRKVVLCR